MALKRRENTERALRVGMLAAPLALLLPRVVAAQTCGPGWVQGVGLPTSDDVYVSAMEVLPDGDVVVAESPAYEASGTPPSRIHRYHPATNTWSLLGTLDLPASPGNSFVNALALHPSGDVVVAGFFQTAGGFPANNIARVSPSTGLWSVLGAGIPVTVNAVAVLHDGDIVASGYPFLTADGVHSIGRYNPASNTWSWMAGGVGGDLEWVTALTVLQSGILFVSGWFDSAGTVLANGNALYDPAANTWSAPAAGGYLSPNFMKLTPAGDVLLGFGYWSIQKYSPATDTWSDLPSPLNPTYGSACVLPNGDLIAADFVVDAAFTTLGYGIERYRPATGEWFQVGLALASPSQVRSAAFSALTVLPDGDLLVGGGFDEIGGVPARRFARYTFGGPCRADFNCSGELDIQDVIDFLTAWFAADPRCDFDSAGGVQVADIFGFLNAWFVGC